MNKILILALTAESRSSSASAIELMPPPLRLLRDSHNRSKNKLFSKRFIVRISLLLLALFCFCPKEGFSQVSFNCGPGFFKDSDGQCKKCGQRCATCVGSGENCVSCRAGNFIPVSGLPGPCQTCTVMYPISAGSCIRCNTVTCLDVSCNAGFKKNGIKCEKISCPSGQYLNGNSCKTCPSGCTACSGPTNCTACKSGMYLKNGACYSCPANCTACTSSSNCTTCKAGSSLKNGKCEPKTVSSCPSYMTLSSDQKCCIPK